MAAPAAGTAALAPALARVLGLARIDIGGTHEAGGGCIDRALALDTDRGRYFVKLAPSRARLDAEADGIAALSRCPALRLPRVFGVGDIEPAQAILVLEYLPLEQDGDEAALGHALAQLHSIRGPDYGWHRDNFIGATPQANGRLDDWAEFLVARRLRPQLEMAAGRGAGDLVRLAAPILAALPGLFAGDAPPPVLLHGDLWRGNAGFVGGQPAVFDPAVHYGDAEADIAMSELFGGFSPAFYAAYRETRPPPANAATHRRLYALYHVLNHYNLFGGAYAEQARRMIARFTAEIRAA